MTKSQRSKLLDGSAITAGVLVDWNHPKCKFTPDQLVKVKSSAVRTGERGRYRKYASKRGVVVAVSSRDGFTVRGDNRQFTRYFVAFPELDNKVVGLQSHYLKAV